MNRNWCPQPIPTRPTRVLCSHRLLANYLVDNHSCVIVGRYLYWPVVHCAFCEHVTSTVMGMPLVRNWLSQQCVNVIAHNCRLGPLHEPHV